jgi:hypothetical protein
VKITKKIEVKKWQLQKNKNKDFTFQSHRQIQVKREEKRREEEERAYLLLLPKLTSPISLVFSPSGFFISVPK